MLAEPRCFKRGCKHYRDIEQPDGTEATEVPVCLAFPLGIPKEIAYGNNKHLKPLKNQGNEIVYEKS